MPYRIKDRLEFLSEASKILSSSLDYNVTLSIIAKLAVTKFSDFCMIDLLDERGKLQRVTSQVASKKLAKLAQQMFDIPSDPKNKKAIYETVKTGSPILIETINNKWLSKASRLPRERRLIKKLKLRSVIFAPLTSRGKIIGALTLVSNNQEFSYTRDDLLLAEELASRAGTAVDKAKLFREAHEAIKLRDEFVSIASHELKTPLTSILLNLQLVQDKIKTATDKKADMDEIERLIEINISQGKRLSKLINDLLNSSVISSGRLRIEKERINLKDVIDNTINKYEGRATRKRIFIKYNQKKIIGRWDAIRLEQVFTNLISNAVKYGKKKPILITVSQISDKAIIKITDKGIGIDTQDQPYVFDLFRRAVDPTSFKGLGIGLFISRQIVEAHGGSLTLESKINRGTTFIIELPAITKN